MTKKIIIHIPTKYSVFERVTYLLITAQFLFSFQTSKKVLWPWNNSFVHMTKTDSDQIITQLDL